MSELADIIERSKESMNNITLEITKGYSHYGHFLYYNMILTGLIPKYPTNPWYQYDGTTTDYNLIKQIINNKNIALLNLQSKSNFISQLCILILKNENIKIKEY
jgi:hypothetical protein